MKRRELNQRQGQPTSLSLVPSERKRGKLIIVGPQKLVGELLNIGFGWRYLLPQDRD